MKYRMFASSGSCLAEIKQIKGVVSGITFTSKEFTGTMDSQKFWDDLREFAKKNNAYIELIY